MSGSGRTPGFPVFTAAALLSVLAALAGVLASACSSKQQKPREVPVVVNRDIPAALRGTVGAEVTIGQLEPVLVSGYGLVVGLKGTGGGDLPEAIAATMDRELGLRGVGKGGPDFRGTPFEGMSPKELLRSPDVAVVIVSAAIQPAAPKGATFDVYVQALNSSGFVSLEGGRLWTTDLVIGPAATLSQKQTHKMAEARGPIFINPFSDSQDGTDLTRSTGRILRGGRITTPLKVEMRMDNPSWRRVQSIQSAINSRIPRRPEDEDMAARGKSDVFIMLSVPQSYSQKSDEFLSLVRHVQIDQSFPQEFARRYVDALSAQPYIADDLAWCLVALPNRVGLPFVRPLYDSPELGVRMAALTAGALLDDSTSADALLEIARSSGQPEARAKAMVLLGRLQSSPKVDLALRGMLSEPALDVRVAAYEALRLRAERELVAMARSHAPRTSAGALSVDDPDENGWDAFDYRSVSIQGVRTRPITGSSPQDVKFFLDVVPAGEPLIYVTQQGTPRVVLFGEGLELARPVYAEAWKGRLILAADTATDTVRLMYKPSRGADSERTITSKSVGPGLEDLIAYFAKEPTPENPAPGLSMSYSDVVGALYAIQKSGAVKAYFATEEDRLAARLLLAASDSAVPIRPETLKEEQVLKVNPPATPSAVPKTEPDKPQGPLVEPLSPPPAK